MAVTYPYTEDFTDYLATNWLLDSIFWESSGGTFTVTPTINDRTFAKINSAYGSTMIFQAKVTPGAIIIADNSQSIGIALWYDNKNYWRLAFIQNAAGVKGMELSERLDDEWGAHYSTGSNPLTSYGTQSSTTWSGWSIGTAYLLRLTISEHETYGMVIVGEVIDATDGVTILWRRGYRLETNNSVRTGLPALVTSNEEGTYDDVSVADFTETTGRTATYPTFDVATNPNIKRIATGFFYPKRLKNDNWTIIAPNGEAFYAIGTDHITYQGMYCYHCGTYPYKDYNDANYASEEEWADETVARLKVWGYNLIGWGHSDYLLHKGLAHATMMRFGAGFCSLNVDDYSINPPSENTHVFPNVFNPKFAQYCDIVARETIGIYADDPFLFGYFLDNELLCYGTYADYYNEYGIADKVISLAATHTAKLYLVDWLEAKYTTIEALNTAWGSAYASFEAMLSETTFTGSNTATVIADKTVFTRHAVETYYSVTTTTIRTYDTNHMILGDRQSGNAKHHNAFYEIGSKYLDVTTFNLYGYVNLDTEDVYYPKDADGGDTNPSLESELARYYNLAKTTPLMITEWSFNSSDRGHKNTVGSGQAFTAQAQRATAFDFYQRKLFSLPYVVGSDWFMWPDQHEDEDNEHRNSNYGLVDNEGAPYSELTSAMAALNANVYDTIAVSGLANPPLSKIRCTPSMKRILFNPQSIVKKGLVGWYKLDEGAGQVVSDSTGRGNNGQLGSDVGVDSADPAWIASGLSFGGDDYVKFPLAVDPQLDFTIFMAISVGAELPVAQEFYLSIGNSGSNTQSVGLYRSETTGNISFYMRNDAGVQASSPIITGVTGGNKFIVMKRCGNITTAKDMGRNLLWRSSPPTNPLTCNQMAIGCALKLAASVYLNQPVYGMALYDRATTPTEDKQNFLYFKGLLASKGIVLH